MKNLIIIPTYNESLNIESVIQRINKSLPNAHILIIDDSSPDGTGDLIAALSESQYKSRLNLISRPQKMGLGSAYVKGFNWALDKEYDFIFQMDGDASHQPEDLLRLLEAARQSDLALATRYIKNGKTEGWPLHRLLLSRMANLYAKLVTGMPFHDLTGGMKCYTKKALETLCKNKIQSDGYAFQIETTFYVYSAGYRISEVPIVFKDRTKGQSKLSRRIIWEAIFLVLRLGISRLFPKPQELPR